MCQALLGVFYNFFYVFLVKKQIYFMPVYTAFFIPIRMPLQNCRKVSSDFALPKVQG